MNLRSVGRLSWIALATLVACKPAAHGSCSSYADCRDGSFCSLAGVCVAPSGNCAAGCAPGEICSFGECIGVMSHSPPQIGAIAILTSGAVGEDGQTWFAGGSGAPAVEIAVPVTDTGGGVASVSVRLLASDVAAGTPLDVSPVMPPPADGRWHFRLPASAVRGREGQMRFTITALDNAQDASSAPGAILVDALPPFVSAPHVDYSSALPALLSVCSPPESATFHCGRGTDHLLRDDSATISFDVRDCGAGIAAAPAAIASSGGATVTLAMKSGSNGGPCTSSTNTVHHYAFTLDLSKLGSLDPSDVSGTSLVHLVASAVDAVGNVAQGQAPAGATSGDGLALVSLVRWRAQLRGVAAGAPALLPGAAGARQVAVGTDAAPTGGAANLFVLNPDGSLAWSASVTAGIARDIAVGSSGVVYSVSGDLSPCGSNTHCGTFSVIVPPASGTTGTVYSCSQVTGAGLNAPPAITTAPGSPPSEIAIVAATSQDTAGVSKNAFVFQYQPSSATKCKQLAAQLLGAANNVSGQLTGVSIAGSTYFFSHGGGFTSVPQLNGTDIDTSVANSVSFNGSVPALAPPSLSGSPANDAIFGGGSSDKKVHRTQKSGSVTIAWNDLTGFPTPAAGSALPFSPVFDGTNIHAADDQGTVYTWSEMSGGSPVWSVSLGAAVSAPVLMQNGSLLVLKNSGTLALVSAAGMLNLVTLGSFSPQSPSPPAVDQRGSWGLAYVADGGGGNGPGWVSAVQLPALPVLPTTTIWPRPGRDSCNSRNAGSSCN